MNLNKLSGHIPNIVLSQINEVVTKFAINTPVKLSHFLSQAAHESGGFKVTTENLNYSSKGLLSVFKKYFPTQALADTYARKPEKIANLVYGNRMGNGPETSGDGFRYRGRGYLQLTGKNNYALFDKVVPENILINPDLVATKYPLLSAAWFFHKNCLGRCKDATYDSVISVTKCVNGGSHGILERKNYFLKYYDLLR